jgi:hypothetical protein
MSFKLSCRLISAFTLLALNATAYSAISIRESLSWFPVAENIALGMGVEEFRAANQTAKPLTANEFKADGSREGHICFGESLEPQTPKGKVENRLYFSFLQGKLAQVEWKQSGENLNPGLVRGYGTQMAQVGSKLPSEQKSFFAIGGVAPFYTATQERYQLKDGTLATLTATKPLFTAAITDVKYLKDIGKEDFFQKASDDHAIAEWKKEQGDMAGLSEKVIDYLVVSDAGTDTDTATNRTLPKASALQSVPPPAPKKAPSTAPAPSTPSEEPSASTPWSIIVVLIVAAMGLLWLLVKNRK